MVVADVLVVGGGPAGAAAAIALARAGRDVLVVDRARFPRDKCCGDGLTAAALRHMDELGVTLEAVQPLAAVDEAWIRAPSGYTARFPMPRGQGLFAAVAPRQVLDAAILDAARAAGATVRDGHRLTGARVGPDGVEADCEGLGPVRARYAIGADGAWSPLRHALGANEPGYLGDWHAFRQYFSGVGPAAGSLWVWFEPDLLPGYAWSFPLPDGRANVGFGIQRGGDIEVRDMKNLWPDLLARSHLRSVLGEAARPEGTHRAWPIPARLHRVPLTAGGGRALFVGDAASATDPLTGEGIAQAFLTGRLAAEAVVGAGPDRPVLAARRYEADVGRELLADHRMSLALSRVLRHRKGAGFAIRLADASGWSRRNFARWLFEDYPRAAAVTPRRWRRGLLTGPGAYPQWRPA
jgi:geranylgeranyl reductase family protein